jgi:GNAT superfamily N-acetyltransferase
MVIESLGTATLAPAARLVAARIERARTHTPGLAAPDARALLEATLGAPDGGAGVVAVRDGAVVGVMAAYRDTANFAGRSAWVPLSSHALAPGEPPRTLQRLYAALATPLVIDGIFEHFVCTFACEPEIEAALHALSFGRQQVYAARSSVDAADPVPTAVRVRRAGPDDAEAVAALGAVLPAHMWRAPTFGAWLPEWRAGLPGGYAGALADSDHATFVAVANGEVVAFQLWGPADPGKAIDIVPQPAAELSTAVTAPRARGRGAMRALHALGLGWARDRGHTICIADWRSANLEADGAWTALGYAPYAHRLHRHVDPRVAWARDPASLR